MAALKRRAIEPAEGLRATIDAIRAEGVVSANGIAGRLNEREFATPRGGRWSALGPSYAYAGGRPARLLMHLRGRGRQPSVQSSAEVWRGLRGSAGRSVRRARLDRRLRPRFKLRYPDQIRQPLSLPILGQ